MSIIQGINCNICPKKRNYSQQRAAISNSSQTPSSSIFFVNGSNGNFSANPSNNNIQNPSTVITSQEPPKYDEIQKNKELSCAHNNNNNNHNADFDLPTYENLKTSPT